eukprot:GEMP01035650.1.p1 GENE.GEMP01035650.1~~GEMP01035650.1.p1  ORF type:complete len:337 (+),score=53.37 GEMP01035650.1:470-1480(+)
MTDTIHPDRKVSQDNSSTPTYSRDGASLCVGQRESRTLRAKRTSSLRAQVSSRTVPTRAPASPNGFSPIADHHCGDVPVGHAISAGGSLRRFGRPPVPTWEFLYERGKDKLHQRNYAVPKTESFTPKLDQHSLELASAKERVPLWNPKVSKAKLHTMMSPKSVKVNLPLPDQVQIFIQRMEKHRELSHQKRTVQVMMVSDKEIQHCSFHPLFSSSRRAQSHNAVPPRRCGSLYERGIRSMKAKVEAAIEWQKRKEEEEIASCRLASLTTNYASNCNPPTSSSQLHVDDNAYTAMRQSVFQVDPTEPDVEALERKVLWMLIEWREKMSNNQAVSTPS